MGEELGRRIRERRNELGLNQADVAEPHYSHAYMSYIENGKREPTITALEHIASVLGLDAAELRDLTEYRMLDPMDRAAWLVDELEQILGRSRATRDIKTTIDKRRRT